MPLQKFRLISIVEETHEVKTYRFEPSGKFAFKAGQFVLLRIGSESRAYSISSHPSEKSIELTIRNGEESYFPKKIEKLSVGEVVEMDGPFGMFTLDAATKSAVFIGAGVGIAGLKSLWTEAARNSAKTVILYSARTEKEIIWRSAFDKMKATVVYTLTREKPNGWRGETGRIDAAMLKRLIKTPKSNHYYICGPPEMVEAAEAALIELDVPEQQVKAEKWGGIAASI